MQLQRLSWKKQEWAFCTGNGPSDIYSDRAYAALNGLSLVFTLTPNLLGVHDFAPLNRIKKAPRTFHALSARLLTR